ncbi:hypothetical protein Tco_1534080 [Tanacetum coccineum]
MSMTIQSGVKDKILVTLSETPKVENALAEMLRDMDQQMERRADDGKANVVTDVLSRKERVKPRRVPLVGSEMDEAHASSKEWSFSVDHLRLRWEIYFVVLADAVESIMNTTRWCMAYHPQMDGQSERVIRTLEVITLAFGVLRSKHYMEEDVGHPCYGLKLEKLKAARDRQKSYADNRRKPLEFEVGDRVMLKVSPWKGVVHFGKKGKLAPRYVGPFEILERIGPVAYRLRLSEELSGVHDTFHVSNLKKCLADASLHVPLDEIKVDKTLRFVEEPVEIMDREIKSLKRSKISLVKVRWNSKRGPEFTWEREDYMKSKYPQLFVDRADESAS